MIHHVRLKNRGSEGEVALKLNINKAYDRVNWKFLHDRMKEMNFSHKWIDWMLFAVKNVSYLLCLNEFLVGPIYPKCGLIPGDLLSLIYSSCAWKVFLMLLTLHQSWVVFMVARSDNQLQLFLASFSPMTVFYFSEGLSKKQQW